MNSSEPDDFAASLGHDRTPPVGTRDLQRPKAGSWLDKNARRMAEMLSEDFGLAGFDPDVTYLMLAEDLRRTRAMLSDQMGVSLASARKWIDDDALRSNVAKVAVGLVEEKPGTDPFADQKTVRMPVDVWARALWSLQIAAVATHSFSDAYSLSMLQITTNMAGVLARGAHEMPGATFRAPHGGSAYVARACEAAAEQIAEWECPIDGLTTDQLVGGLREDSALLGKAIAAREE